MVIDFQKQLVILHEQPRYPLRGIFFIMIWAFTCSVPWSACSKRQLKGEASKIISLYWTFVPQSTTNPWSHALGEKQSPGPICITNNFECLHDFTEEVCKEWKRELISSNKSFVTNGSSSACTQKIIISNSWAGYDNLYSDILFTFLPVLH